MPREAEACTDNTKRERLPQAGAQRENVSCHLLQALHGHSRAGITLLYRGRVPQARPAQAGHRPPRERIPPGAQALQPPGENSRAQPPRAQADNRAHSTPSLPGQYHTGCRAEMLQACLQAQRRQQGQWQRTEPPGTQSRRSPHATAASRMSLEREAESLQQSCYNSKCQAGRHKNMHHSTPYPGIVLQWHGTPAQETPQAGPEQALRTSSQETENFMKAHR
jgi:hypothetical protein